MNVNTIRKHYIVLSKMCSIIQLLVCLVQLASDLHVLHFPMSLFSILLNKAYTPNAHPSDILRQL